MTFLPSPTSIRAAHATTGGFIVRFGDFLDTVNLVVRTTGDGDIADVYTVVAPDSGPMVYVTAVPGVIYT